MAVPISHCCCGCSLRGGTISIAVYMLVCSVLIILSSSGYLHSLSTYVGDKVDTLVEAEDPVREIYQAVKVGLISGIVVGVVQSIPNVLLLIGVLKEKRSLVITWLVLYALYCGLGLLALVISFFRFPPNLPLQVTLVISIGLYTYFLLVVWSFHKSPEARYNKLRNAADVYDTENCNRTRMPLA